MNGVLLIMAVPLVDGDVPLVDGEGNTPLSNDANDRGRFDKIISNIAEIVNILMIAILFLQHAVNLLQSDRFITMKITIMSYLSIIL